MSVGFVLQEKTMKYAAANEASFLNKKKSVEWSYALLWIMFATTADAHLWIYHIGMGDNITYLSIYLFIHYKTH